MDNSGSKSKANHPTAVELRTARELLDVLKNGDIEIKGLVPWSSNSTYLVRVQTEQHEALAIYKPSCGERPLWDFETGTLCNREVAAYLVSVVLGWPNVPATVLRDGPRGVGALQQFIEFRRRENFFTIRDKCPDDMRRIAAFDAIINNTDRKGGHVLVDHAGAVWCIDHGVTFHEDPKLRTVIWDFTGEPIPDALLNDMRGLRQNLRAGKSSRTRLDALLSRSETRALDARISELVREGVYPDPPVDWPHIPWPPI
jgi:uncharacterized repeat protein (TIGR03843 family)